MKLELSEWDKNGWQYRRKELSQPVNERPIIENRPDPGRGTVENKSGGNNEGSPGVETEAGGAGKETIKLEWEISEIKELSGAGGKDYLKSIKKSAAGRKISKIYRKQRVPANDS